MEDISLILEREAKSTSTTFASYFSPTHDQKDGKKTEINMECPTPGMLSEAESPKVNILDARASLQQNKITMETARLLFKEKAFALFPHKSEVKDWSEGYIRGMILGNDITRIYAPEVEEIIRNHLLREYHVIAVKPFPAVLKRGPDSQNNFYGTGVHQDYGMTISDYRDNVESYPGGSYAAKAHEKLFSREDVKGFMMINFWRPVEMSKPLQFKPLAVLDPTTVNTEDVVWTGLNSKPFGGTGRLTNQAGLRYKPKHQWYYYPDMTNDEVLVFKQLECWKGEADGLGPSHWKDIPVRSVFHTAFSHPDTPSDAEPRTSTEYRVPVYLGKKKTPEELANSQDIVLPRADGCCSIM